MSAEISPPGSDGPLQLAEAEEAFVDFLMVQSDRGADAFEDLCRAHPHLHAALRQLKQEHDEASRICEELKQASSLATVPRGPREDWNPQWQALVQRLSRKDQSEPRYQLQGEVAAGGMGVILKVWDHELQRSLAMKVSLEDLPARERGETPGTLTLGRFLEEAQVTGQLDHPGIVPVHELGIDEQRRVYFTMRLVEGHNLRQVIEWVHAGVDGWTETGVLSVILKVCEAVAYAHSKGVIHRDLKPSNIMVGRFGEVYTMDWGLAKVRDRIEEEKSATGELPLDEDPAAAPARPGPAAAPRTQRGAVLGTPSYMPPEQARGELQAVDARSDIYAIGAMLYHSLTGRVPYVESGETPSAREILHRVRTGAPRAVDRIRPAVPPELQAICERAMARQPEGRYPSTERFAADLRAYLEQRVVRAYEAGPLAELRKWVLRNRGTAATLAAALAIAGSLLGLLYLQSERSAGRISQANQQLLVSNQSLSAARHEAQMNLDHFLRLADHKVLRRLRTKAEELWPAHPDKVAELKHWLTEARALAGQLPVHRAYLARLNESSSANSSGSIPRDQRLPDLAADLIEELEEFVASDPQVGAIAAVEQRLQQAQNIARISIEEPADLWELTIEEVALGELYVRDGEELWMEPQVGLVPLGADPDSGLQEFWLVQSGPAPQRTPGSGLLQLRPDSGIVLVLVPGGSFVMGAQSEDPERPQFDPDVPPSSRPHSVELEPFLLSKYELTQGQWRTFMGPPPSLFPTAAVLRTAESDLLPVEQVDYLTATRALARLGLVLPTEAQWEYATRAGSTTRWWCGNEPQSIGLLQAGNVHDRTSEAARPDGLWGPGETWRDGFPNTAPVGSFTANDFGIHDVLGNVLEWCQDAFGSYDVEIRVADGLRLVEHSAEGRVYRGGSFDFGALAARSAYREFNTPDTASFNLGIRPCRSLDP
jgi:serine/threonine protein kinase/formylglycine-generating enzyme required for sulfatase activity